MELIEFSLILLSVRLFLVQLIEFWKKQGYKVTGKAVPVTLGKKVLNPELRGKRVYAIPMQKDIQGDIWLQGPKYNVPLRDIRTILSETTSKNDLAGAKFAKQMWYTIMHCRKDSTNPDLIKSMSDKALFPKNNFTKYFEFVKERIQASDSSYISSRERL